MIQKIVIFKRLHSIKEQSFDEGERVFFSCKILIVIKRSELANVGRFTLISYLNQKVLISRLGILWADVGDVSFDLMKLFEFVVLRQFQCNHCT